MYVHVSSYIYIDDIVWKIEPDLLLILFPVYKPNVSITGKGKCLFDILYDEAKLCVYI